MTFLAEERAEERASRTLLVFDWAYDDPKTGREMYARTPEKAEKLAASGVKLTPVYTIFSEGRTNDEV